MASYNSRRPSVPTASAFACADVSAHDSINGFASAQGSSSDGQNGWPNIQPASAGHIRHLSTSGLLEDYNRARAMYNNVREDLEAADREVEGLRQQIRNMRQEKYGFEDQILALNEQMRHLKRFKESILAKFNLKGPHSEEEIEASVYSESHAPKNSVVNRSLDEVSEILAFHKADKAGKLDESMEDAISTCPQAEVARKVRNNGEKGSFKGRVIKLRQKASDYFKRAEKGEENIESTEIPLMADEEELSLRQMLDEDRIREEGKKTLPGDNRSVLVDEQSIPGDDKTTPSANKADMLGDGKKSYRGRDRVRSLKKTVSQLFFKEKSKN